MGMYTAFHFNVRLIDDVPQDVTDTLKYMLDKYLDIKSYPVSKYTKHKTQNNLFDTDRWDIMLKADSYYFAEDTHSTLRYDKMDNTYHLCIRCNLKNYDNEIDKFVHWISPYVDARHGDFLGFSRYENQQLPTLIFYTTQQQDKEFDNQCIPMKTPSLQV